MRFSTTASGPEQGASERQPAAELLTTRDDIIVQLTRMILVASGKQPIRTVRRTRDLADGGQDTIELPVFRIDLKFALLCLNALAALRRPIPLGPTIAAIDTGFTSTPAVDEGEQAMLTALLRRYDDGSHPSLKLGK